MQWVGLKSFPTFPFLPYNSIQPGVIREAIIKHIEIQTQREYSMSTMKELGRVSPLENGWGEILATHFCPAVIHS